MSLSKLAADLDNISKLDDEPNDVGGLTAEDLKVQFDKAGNAIKTFINDTLTREIDEQKADKSEVRDIVLGQIPDGTITAEKLSSETNASINSKAPNALPDDVAAALGLTGNPQVKDALALLSRLNAGLGNEYVWKKSLNSYAEKRDSGSSTLTIYSENTYYAKISNFISINQTTGAVSLAEPITSISFTYSSFSESPFIGKYFSCSAENYAKINYVPTSGYNVVRTNNREVDIYGTYSVTSQFSSVLHGYVNSPLPNAYPPAVSDGYTYTALNQLGDKAQIATGSYTGTGTYGSSNKNSLTFGFTAKRVFIFPNVANEFRGEFVNPCTVGDMRQINSSGFKCTTVAWDGNSVSWYDTTGAPGQCNNTGMTYYYIAIG